MTTHSWPELLRDYQAAMRLSRRPETLRTRMSYLRLFAATMPTEPTTDQVITWLGERDWSPATRKSAQCSLRSFYSWARRTGRFPTDPTLDLDPITVPAGLPRPASEACVARGRAAVSPDVRLMVELAAQHGLRRSEIAGLRRSDLTDEGLRVRGKGGKVRLIPVTDQVRRMIECRPRGYVFPGRFTGHVHPSTVQRWIRDAAGVSPHPLRHRCATRGYRGTRDLFAVQDLLGHSSADTTRIYTKLDPDAKRAVIEAAA